MARSIPARTPITALGARSGTDYPTEPIYTPQQLKETTTPRSASKRFMRDVFTFSSLESSYSLSNVPITDSESVYNGDRLVMCNADIIAAPCYLDPDNRSVLKIKPNFPGSDGDTIIVRYVSV